MKFNNSCTPETAAGHKPAEADATGEITDKRGFGLHWQFSTRHVDNLIAQGLPHLKIGKRRVRILIPEADAWMRQKFGHQRRGPARTPAKSESQEAA